MRRTSVQGDMGSIGSTMAQIARGGPEPRNWYLGFNITRKFY